ncbi:MAG: GTPase Era [Oscillospiraceae bacterium]|nr:GTPase Era [Oscillospiraceae bacterium]
MTDKTVVAAVVGRPNVGKSTLVNALVGEKIAIVSPKPQTTRNRIFGIFEKDGTQVVLLDTPGFHRARTRLGDYMVKAVGESVADVDAALLVVEPVDNIGVQEAQLIERIRASGAPAILVVNKTDTVKKEDLLPVIARYGAAYEFDAVVPLSAKTGDGVQELVSELLAFAQEGGPLFPDDMITDQTERQMCAELVREKLLLTLQREVPHGTAVEVTRFAERENGVTDIDVTIYCEKAGHKGIIIGRNGAALKKVGELARRDIEKLLGGKVCLKTWVKVKENWRDSDVLIKNFGYTDD